MRMCSSDSAMTRLPLSSDETQSQTDAAVRSVEVLFEKAMRGDRRSLARLFTRLERDALDLREIMRLAYAVVGRGSIIGITGPPGAGKSTIVDGLTSTARTEGKTVGVLAVDPTSPFTGGAVLGDRIRMQSHPGDPGVYIRSLATKGAPGGLNAVTRAGVKLLDAVGRDLIIVETVGVGQSEYDIMGVADHVIVVLVPEAGDSVQTMKAGLLEIADTFVVNKSDRDGAGQLSSALRSMISLQSDSAGELPPVLLTQAHKGEGIAELYDRTSARISQMRCSGELAQRRSRQAAREVSRLLRASANRAVDRILEDDSGAAELVELVLTGALDPHMASRKIIASGTIAKAMEAEILSASHCSGV